MIPKDHHFARILEIHRDLACDIRLHLTQTPFRAVRVSDEHAWFQ